MRPAPGNRIHDNRGAGIRAGVAIGALLIAGLGIAVAIQHANSGVPPAPVAQVSTPTPTPKASVSAQPQPTKGVTVTPPEPTSAPTTKAPAIPARDPALVGLKPEIVAAVGSAQRAAAAAGVTLVINSGRRSPAQQQRLLDAEVRKRGSYEAAIKWVLPPNDSAHVKGEAVDFGPAPAASWLERNGYRWGLCRRYRSESWHFELLTAPGQRCPPMEASPQATR